MRKAAICLSIILLTSPAVYAQFDNVGTSAANFLKIGVGGRGEAMGGAFSAQANDVTALYWNPAGIAQITRNGFAFSRTDWLLDIDLTYVGIALPFGDTGTAGFSINSLSMGSMEQTTHEQPEGTGITFDAGDIAMGVSFARRVTDRLLFGITGKYIREQVANSSASAVAIDIGTQYLTDFRGLVIGMSILNFGTKMRLRGREQLVDVDIDPTLHSNPDVVGRLDTKAWPLPLSFRLGTSLKLMQNESMSLTGNIDYSDPRDMNPLYAAGAEFEWMDMVFLRGGYRLRFFGENYNGDESSEDFFTVGGGLKLTLPRTAYTLEVDYSYSELGILNDVQRFTTSFSF